MIKDAQHYLNRLYTEQAFRDAFFANREQFFLTQPITDAPLCDFLSALKKEQVEFFSQGLIAKRLHAVKNLVPITAQFLGNHFAPLFKAFCEGYLPTGVHKHHADALAFITYVRTQALFKNSLHKNILDFESDLIHNFIRPAAWRVRLYRINPLLLQKTKAPFTGLKKQLTLIAWRHGKIKKVLTRH